MVSVIIPIMISFLLGGILYFLISNLLLENMVKLTIILLVMVTSYTLVNESLQSRHTD